MPVSLKRDELNFRRVFVFDVTGEPRQSKAGCHDIVPETATIDLMRDGEHTPWEILWITVAGKRVLSNDNVGTSDVRHHYMSGDGATCDPDAPEWFATLVADTYALAERERINPPAV